MKILLTHGYFLEEDPREKKVMKPYPPLGLLYISAWLEKSGFENQVFDTTFETKEALQHHLEVYQPDIVALYTNLVTKVNVVAIIDFIKSSAFLKDALVVVGGPDVTYNIDNYLKSGADLLVIGEGEQTMLEIAKEFRKGSMIWQSIAGVAFLLPDRQVFKTVGREKMKDLDLLPLPNRAKIDLGKYLSTWQKHHGMSAISVSTQRGCPYTCNWCSTAVYGQSYRRRSAKSVVDELEFLQKHYNPGQIWFVDDVFTVSHKWIESFHQEVTTREIIIPFECITRAERLDDKILRQLKECGCFRIWIGAESGSQKFWMLWTGGLTPKLSR
ncbi:MAG: B12-binding domain-containing radical SAM protein [Saprospiraceae bacterium]|nr:B12-binding domain-containing radical SAM protein [Saprospiraceae bacterium]